jgi:hypothetical protein
MTAKEAMLPWSVRLMTACVLCAAAIVAGCGRGASASE